MPIFTLDQYNALIDAIALGALEVQYSDKKVTYRSLNDMRALANDMAADLGLDAAFNSNAGRRVADYNSGK
jgi:hypothetical protein